MSFLFLVGVTPLVLVVMLRIGVFEVSCGSSGAVFPVLPVDPFGASVVVVVPRNVLSS